MSYQYAESPISSSAQSSFRIAPYDPFPRTLPNNCFVTPSNLVPNSFNPTTSCTMSHPQQFGVWGDSATISPPTFGSHTNKDIPYYHEPPSYITTSDRGGIYTSNMTFPEVPRGWGSYSPKMIPEQPQIDTFDTPGYMIEASTQHLENPTPEFTRHAMSFSPIESEIVSCHGLPLFDKPGPFSMPPSESSDEGGNRTRETTAVEVEIDDQGSDEPYAKLIYRALMSAPNHSMVLQEIYQWFRNNTTKGSSDTKGWMNSIRHNLSMNAV